MKKILLFLFTMIIVSTAAEAAVLRGDLDLQGDVTIANGCWELLSETDVTTPISDLTVSGLSGDTDEVYKVRAKLVGNTGGGRLDVTLNGLRTAALFGEQNLYGSNATMTANRHTSMDSAAFQICSTGGVGQLGQGEMIIDCSSAVNKIGINMQQWSVANTTVTGVGLYAYVMNSPTELTSIGFVSEFANGMNTGTHIELWRKKS